MNHPEYFIFHECIDSEFFRSISSIFPMYNVNSKSLGEFDDSVPSKEEEEKIYFKTNDKKTTEFTSNFEIIPIKPLMFKTEKVEEPKKSQEIQRKRGRQPKSKKKKYIKILGRKYQRDNILTKNQVHYLTYIIIFLNLSLKAFNIKEEFKQLNYDLKKKVDFEFFIQLQNKTLAEIISMDISPKNKKFKANYNQLLCETIENKVIQKILKQNYLDFFKNVYYPSKKWINLKDFGNEKDLYIVLDDAKKQITYKDKVKSFKENYYAERYDQFVREHYSLYKIEFKPKVCS